jgi:hypothetical protein
MKPKALKCPKCKSLRLQLSEYYVVVDIHYQNTRGVITTSPLGAGNGYGLKVECFCLKCGHQWKTKRWTSEIGTKEINFPAYTSVVDKEFTDWLNGGFTIFEEYEKG